MSCDPHDQLLLQIRDVVAEYEHTLVVERGGWENSGRSLSGFSA